MTSTGGTVELLQNFCSVVNQAKEFAFTRPGFCHLAILPASGNILFKNDFQ